MARETRRGRIAAPAAAIGTSYNEAREQSKLEKKRKRYELEQAKKHKKKQDASCVLPSGDDRVSRSQALEISKLYAVPASETPPSPYPSSPTQGRRTRQEKPSCTDYGHMRVTLFTTNQSPPFFFVTSAMLGIVIKILFQKSSRHLFDINVSLIIELASFHPQSCPRLHSNSDNQRE